MAREVLLLSDAFPQGVVLRLTPQNNRFTVRWQYRQKPHQVTADTIGEAVEEACRVLAVLQNQGALV